MGNSTDQLAAILPLIQKIRNEITKGKFYELGDNPRSLDEMETKLSKISDMLESSKIFYSQRPLPESNPYYYAVRIIRRTQDELAQIRLRGEGSRANTARMLSAIDELERAVDSILGIHASQMPQLINLPGETESTGNAPIEPSVVPSTPGSKKNNLLVYGKKTANGVGTPIFKAFFRRLLSIVFMSSPRIIGRAILDIAGRDKARDTTAIVLGYILITFGGLLIWGIVDINAMLRTFSSIWRSFFPIQ